MGNQHESQEEIEIDLKELFFEVLGNWKMICISAFLTALIAFSISKFIIVPQYESTSALYVLTKSTSITSLTDLQMGTNLTNDYIVVVKCRPVLEQVIDNLDLDLDYKQLGSKISVDNPSDSRILNITVTDPDPAVAKQIADEMANVSSAYIAEKMDQDPPRTIQNGYADGEPVSPSVGKNTVIGAFLGMLLAMAIVIVSYLMNDSIMTPEDLEKKVGLHVLGSLPLEDEAEYDGESSRKKRKGKGSATGSKSGKVKKQGA